MKKVITGSILAAGVAASLFGAGPASAAPGVSVAVGDTEMGIGDHGAQDTDNNGARAISSPTNSAVAVSLGAPARAAAGGTGTTALAVGLIGPEAAEAGAVGH